VCGVVQGVVGGAVRALGLQASPACALAAGRQQQQPPAPALEGAHTSTRALGPAALPTTTAGWRAVRPKQSGSLLGMPGRARERRHPRHACAVVCRGHSSSRMDREQPTYPQGQHTHMHTHTYTHAHTHPCLQWARSHRGAWAARTSRATAAATAACAPPLRRRCRPPLGRPLPPLLLLLLLLLCWTWLPVG
jgi:hypothetical protein